MSMRPWKLGVLLATGSDTASFRHGLGLIAAALRHGVETYVYCVDDAVAAVTEPALQELRRAGVRLFACALGAQRRRVPITDAAAFSGLATLSDLISATDRFVSFSHGTGGRSTMTGESPIFGAVTLPERAHSARCLPKWSVERGPLDRVASLGPESAAGEEPQRRGPTRGPSALRVQIQDARHSAGPRSSGLRRVLVVVSADPRTSPRASEALRLATGIAAWQKLSLAVYLHGPAVACLDAWPEELMGGDELAQCVPILRDREEPVYFASASPELVAMELPERGVRAIPITGLARLADAADVVIRF